MTKMSKAMSESPENAEFVKGKVFLEGLLALGGASSEIRLENWLLEIENTKNVKFVEKMWLYCKGIDLWRCGHWIKAVELWEQILVEDPMDILAVKFCHSAYFFLGEEKRMRDSIARILPVWESAFDANRSDSELKLIIAYLYGMYAFGLEESRDFILSEKIARKALLLNPDDIWSTHALCHILLEQGRAMEGIKFLENTHQNWSSSLGLACHVYWHLGIYHLELNDASAALNVFDNKLMPAVERSNGFSLDLADAASLLWRIENTGISVGSRWQRIDPFVDQHLLDGFYPFNDTHFVMNLVRRKDSNLASRHIQRLKREAESDMKGDRKDIYDKVGIPLCEALVDFARGNYARTISTLYDLKYQIFRIGGSIAQRDIFHITLLESSLRNNTRNLSRSLALERLNKNPESKMNRKFLERSVGKSSSTKLLSAIHRCLRH